MSTAKKFYATRDFNDAGSEKSFKFGDDVTGEPGVANYVAAGAASDKKPRTAKADTTAA
ncbi:hypothetical protein [Sphingomonas sp. Leaf37]|uniref:hypothetical protein n=1 Tax=Sphingomonas sp. Leaf37 TaxID=2876552 RepID=UPI001E38363D|nr:hypothetical protein [Sphingomonas sp. Leaf37]